MVMIFYLSMKRLLTVGDRSTSFRAIRRKRNFVHKQMMEKINQFHERTERDRKNEYKRKHLSVKEIENELLMDKELDN